MSLGIMLDSWAMATVLIFHGRRQGRRQEGVDRQGGAGTMRQDILRDKKIDRTQDDAEEPEVSSLRQALGPIQRVRGESAPIHARAVSASQHRGGTRPAGGYVCGHRCPTRRGPGGRPGTPSSTCSTPRLQKVHPASPAKNTTHDLISQRKSLWPHRPKIPFSPALAQIATPKTPQLAPLASKLGILHAPFQKRVDLAAQHSVLLSRVIFSRATAGAPLL